MNNQLTCWRVIMMVMITWVYYPCSDPYHTEPFKALQDWTDHLDRMAELNKIFPGDHPAYYEPKKPLPLPERRATSLPPIKGYNFSGNIIRNSHKHTEYILYYLKKKIDWADINRYIGKTFQNYDPGKNHNCWHFL